MKNLPLPWRTLLIVCCLLFFSCAKKDAATAEQTQPAQQQHGYTGDNYKIGVILPMSGKYSVYAESALHGIECAVGIFPPCEGPIQAELIIKDDAADPARAAQSVEELFNEGITVIIGPLSSSSVEAATQKAQSLGVPLISLSQKEGVTSFGDNIFSSSLTATSQVNALVDWATRVKKFKNFAVIYPMNTYGEKYKGLFTTAVEAANGKIVFSESYGESTLDFGSMFRKEHKKFDAVFIPDSYRAVGYISSSMIMEGIKGTQLLGTNRWNNPELIERGVDSLQGAIFVDGFFDASSSLAVRHFVGMFKEAYEINPTILEAIGFDAARLAAKALQSTGGAHTADVRNSLLANAEVEGSTGLIGFDANRELIRKIFLLTVKEENILELE